MPRRNRNVGHRRTKRDPERASLKKNVSARKLRDREYDRRTLRELNEFKRGRLDPRED